jgi:PatG C-terminal
VRGPVAPPHACNGLQVHVVAFDQLYSFDRDSLVKSIPRPEKTTAKEFGSVAEEVLDCILQITRNGGDSHENRALNFLAVRDPAIYAKAAEEFAHNNSLTGVDVRPSSLGGMRKIVDVIFSFTNRSTDVVEKFAVAVDVTEEFPFLVSKLSPYYDRSVVGGR